MPCYWNEQSAGRDFQRQRSSQKLQGNFRKSCGSITYSIAFSVSFKAQVHVSTATDNANGPVQLIGKATKLLSTDKAIACAAQPTQHLIKLQNLFEHEFNTTNSKDSNIYGRINPSRPLTFGRVPVQKLVAADELLFWRGGFLSWTSFLAGPWELVLLHFSSLLRRRLMYCCDSFINVAGVLRWLWCLRVLTCMRVLSTQLASRKYSLLCEGLLRRFVGLVCVGPAFRWYHLVQGTSEYQGKLAALIAFLTDLCRLWVRSSFAMFDGLRYSICCIAWIGRRPRLLLPGRQYLDSANFQ